MGEVTLALREEGEFKRLYAIKRLLTPYRRDDEVRTMFLDEAKIAGLIRHPNVVSVLDVGSDDEGPFLVMDYIEGVSLSRLVNQVGKNGERLPVQVVLRVIGEACRGLHAAHELRSIDGTPLPVIHRDVSPQNILLGFDGIARVTDFGVAKVLDNLAGTTSGLLKGKAGYMAPEQLRFEVLDRRSDLFCLGIVLFEMLAGRRLYTSKGNVPPAHRILKEPPPDLGEERSDLSPQIVALSFRLLAKDSELRPTSALEVAKQVDAIRLPLEAEQGMVDVGRYISEIFGKEREERSTAIAAALENIETLGHIVGGDTIKLHLDDVRAQAVEIQEPEGATIPDRPVVPRARRLLHRLLMVIAVVLLVGVGLVLGSALRDYTVDAEGSGSSASTTAPSESVLMTGTRFVTDADGEVSGPDAGLPAVSPLHEAGGSPSAGDEEEETEADHRTKRPRGMRKKWGSVRRPSHDDRTKHSKEPSSDSRYKLRNWE